MALYWSGAHVAVRYEDGRAEDERDYPADTIVFVMRPEQAGDPEFARAVRHVVALRTAGHGDGSHGEPAGGQPSARDDAERGAEGRFLENFLGGPDVCGADEGSPADEEGLDDLLRDWGMLYGGCAGFSEPPLVQLVINHCDDLVVTS